MSGTTLREQRHVAAHGRRRIIFNSDAGDIDSRECSVADVETFLKSRKSHLAGTSVDSIFYCTDLGFNHYTHNSAVSEVALHWNPALRQFIERGTDPLKITVNFCRANDIEVFWSMRANDGHDQGGGKALSQWKKDHPEYLFSTPENKPWHAPWGCVDYAVPEVRKQGMRVIEDVCSRYDIDGLELDFFRNPVCFKSVAWATVITQEETDVMTEYLRGIRTLMDQIGSRRGRPLLFAVRVPDSVGFCRALGLDIVRWLEEQLMDIMVVGGWWWFQPWERSVQLGHKYDVPVYPCLSGSRVGADPWVLGHRDRLATGKRSECMFARQSPEAYRAHALSAWEAGADGIYLFNFNYNCQSPSLYTELGDPQKLKTLNKLYHVSVMGRGHPSFDTTLPRGAGERFMHLPVLSPDYPQELLAHQPLDTTLSVADDLPAVTRRGMKPESTLNVQITNLPSEEALTVSLNGLVLTAGHLTWKSDLPDTWREYPVDPALVQKGDNRLQITLTENAPHDRPCVLHDVQLRIEYEGAGSGTDERPG